MDGDALSTLGVRAFFLDGVLHLSVILKAAFDVATGALSSPRALLVADVPHNPKNPLSSPHAVHDLALSKLRCDVTVVGAARALGDAPKPRLEARLAIARGSAWSLDKAVFARGKREGEAIREVPLRWESTRGGAGTINPIGTKAPQVFDARGGDAPACFAPIPEQWACRLSRLSAEQRAALNAPIPRIDSTFPLAYFQCASEDQQVPLLQGDEWLFLSGFSSTVAAARTRLPGLAARARIVSSSGSLVNVPLAIDTLAIDANQMIGAAVFRGHVPSPAPLEALGDWCVVARLSHGGASPTLPDLGAEAIARAPLCPLGITPKANDSDATMDARDAPRLAWSAPFQVDGGEAPRSAPNTPIPGAPFVSRREATDASARPFASAPPELRGSDLGPRAIPPPEPPRAAPSDEWKHYFADREPTPPTGSELYRRLLRDQGKDAATVARWVRAWQRKNGI